MDASLPGFPSRHRNSKSDVWLLRGEGPFDEWDIRGKNQGFEKIYPNFLARHPEANGQGLLMCHWGSMHFAKPSTPHFTGKQKSTCHLSSLLRQTQNLTYSISTRLDAQHLFFPDELQNLTVF